MTSGMTKLLNDIMSHCDNLDDFKAGILPKIEKQKDKWQRKIAEILNENKYSLGELARLCEVNKSTVLKWTRGSLPQSREMYIRIGLAAHYNLEEMNRFLQRYGRHPELYSKNAEDSIYIYVLNSAEIDHTYAACKAIFNEINSAQENDIKTDEDIETHQVMDYLLGIKEVMELKQFVEQNPGIFETSFNKFYDYVISFVRKNNSAYLPDDDEDTSVNQADNINLLADTLGWSSSLRKCVYSIYRREWFPTRNRVISLGIHLNMNSDEINTLLYLAKMEPMYIVNPMESVLIYAVLEAELDDKIYEGTDDLYNHVISVFQALGIDKEEYELCDL